MWVGGARAVILDEFNKILMVRQKHKDRELWTVPGGAIEDGENAKEAAVREVREETGFDINIISLLWHIEEVSEKRGQRFVNFFLAGISGGELKLGRDPERGKGEQVLREARFMSHEEIKKLEVVYPEYLRDELWDILADRACERDIFKIRRNLE
jgi:ADP-ribose pyrophosphatase YjhB (NUDIX family)